MRPYGDPIQQIRHFLQLTSTQYTSIEFTFHNAGPIPIPTQRKTDTKTKYIYTAYMQRIFYILLSLIVLASCRAYRVFSNEYRNFSSSEPKRTDYVLNPDLNTEYSILKNAAIFQLVDDSLSSHVVTIKLHPMERQLAAANGIFTTLFTLGQFLHFIQTVTFTVLKKYQALPTGGKLLNWILLQKFGFGIFFRLKISLANIQDKH